MSSPEKGNPFDIADHIFMKRGVVDAVEVGYDPFMMGKICANNFDTIFFANEINKYPRCPKNMSFRFYYEGLERGKRYGKWRKTKKQEEIELIARAYQVNRWTAAQYHKLLDADGIAAISAALYTGGTGKASQKSKKHAPRRVA